MRAAILSARQYPGSRQRAGFRCRTRLTRDRGANPWSGYQNTRRMAAKLRSCGSAVLEVHYRGIGHVAVILSLLPGLRWLTPLRRDMLDFIHSH